MAIYPQTLYTQNTRIQQNNERIPDEYKTDFHLFTQNN